jgi:hypothetical protein
MAERIVCNASPLIFLAKIDKLSLLWLSKCRRVSLCALPDLRN